MNTIPSCFDPKAEAAHRTQDAEPRNREDSTVRRGAGSLGESYACGAGGVEGVGG